MDQDTLLTHSDPIILRNPDESLRNAPGTLVLWRWLGLDRFFPPDRNTWPEVMLTPLPVSKQYDAVFYTEYY